MARQLRGKKPDEVVARKPKCIVFGPPGCAKTTEAMRFPGVYYMDIEGGGTRPQYVRQLRESGGLYFGVEDGSQDFRTVTEEIQALATTEHDRLTLVIDSFSKLYNIAAAMAEMRVGSDFGKDKKEAQKPTRQLMMWLGRLDMNVVLICHRKEKWVRDGDKLASEGGTFDAWDKMEYDLDLVVEVHKRPSFPSVAVVAKTRIEGFPSGTSFPWRYEEFARRAGEETMLSKPKVFKAADAAQVAEVRRLLLVLKTDQDWVDRVFLRAGVTDWTEMDAEKITAVINKLKNDFEGKTDGSSQDA